MKSRILTTISIGMMLLSAACKKDSTDHISTIVEVSYPSITLKGDPIVILNKGASYTDAGASGKDDITGATSDLSPVSNNVNTAETGLYVVNYSISNANGYERTASRIVIVSGVNNPVDYSGIYLRTATGVNCIVTKVAPGVYKVENPGGAGVGAETIVYFVEISPDTFICPPQPTVEGTFAVNEIAFSATGSSWRVDNAGYGTQLRSFVKQ